MRADAVVVGLGAMGLPMAHNVRAAGLEVVGVEPSPARRAVTRLDVVPNVDDAPDADVVIVMVATGEQLARVVDAVAHRDLSGSTWVVTGTIGPGVVRRQAERLRAARAGVVDAPVTGGVAGAEAGTLLLFVSGAAVDIERARPVLESLGTPEVVGGHVGDGQVMKIVNQLLCSVHLVAAAEALALAGRLGLNSERALELLTRGGAASWMLADRGPKMLTTTGGNVYSSVDIFVKDSALVADAAATAGLTVPVLAAARERFVAAHHAGLGTADDSRVIDVYTAREPGSAP